MRTNVIRTSTATVAALGALVSGALTATASSETTSATAPSVVARSTAQRLVQSTGNLYWTANVKVGPTLWQARVYRTGKTSLPGQEKVVYSFYHTGNASIGSLAYALTGGVWYGYVVVNQAGTSRIVRFPPAGGPGWTRAAGLQYIGVNRDLHSDGTYLYWHDLYGIRRMPIVGFSGPSTIYAGTLVNDTSLAGNYLYFARGNSVYRIWKWGGGLTGIASGTSTVTSVAARAYSLYGSVSWSQYNGTVKKTYKGFINTTYTLQGLTPGFHARSVDDNGSRTVWVNDGAFYDALKAKTLSGALTTLQLQTTLGDVTADPTATHYAGATAVWRKVF
jgi:hypothetical protein